MDQETKRRKLAIDTSTGRTGEIMARINVGRHERVYLRPVGGGLEWETDAENVQEIAGNPEQAA